MSLLFLCKKFTFFINKLKLKIMLTLNDFNKVLVEYQREKDKMVPLIENTILGPRAYIDIVRGKRVGVVVAIGDGVLGWSLCNSKDEFDKEKGLSIALHRAHYAGSLSIRGREEIYQKVPDSLIELFEKVNERSSRYFKYEEDEDIYDSEFEKEFSKEEDLPF